MELRPSELSSPLFFSWFKIFALVCRMKSLRSQLPEAVEDKFDSMRKIDSHRTDFKKYLYIVLAGASRKIANI
jgi:hypothetical protein